MHAHSEKTQIRGKNILVLFDFDGTLCRIDSFSRFFKNMLTPPYFYWRCLPLLNKITGYYLSQYPAHLLRPKISRALLHGQSKQQIIEKLPDFTQHILGHLNPELYIKLLWHQAQEHQVYIVSAGLNLYLKPIAEQLNVGLICTQLCLADDLMHYSGEYATPDCSGQEKVNRIKNHLNLAQFCQIYAYGNSEEDYAMLRLAHHPYFVKCDKVYHFSNRSIT